MTKKNRNRPAELPSFSLTEAANGQQGGWALPAITGLGIFLIYLRTLAPSVVGGDTGELVTVAYKLGVAHPPGYPLFTMLAKLFTFIPFGTIAWRVNLLSAVCDSAAAVVILLAIRRWTRNQWAGLLAAGLFAFSPLVWRYAVVGEVFALNNSLVALMFYLAVRYADGHERKFAYLSALVFGLALSNHHTSVFYGAPIMAWILFTGRNELAAFRRLAIIGASMLLGLLPYAYLPLADTRVGAFSWGHPSTLNGFLIHMLRREYGTFQLAPPEVPHMDKYENFLIGMGKYFSTLPRQLSYVGPVLALAGLYFILRHNRTTGLAKVTAVAFCFYLIVFDALANLPLNDATNLTIHMRFWQQATLMICVWAGVGFSALASLIPYSRWRNLTMAAVVLLILFIQTASNFRAEDQHHNRVIADWGHELLRSLPPRSLVWSRGDLMFFALGYLQQCEGYRSDVRVISQEQLIRPWLKRLVNANYPDVSIPGSFYGPPVTGGYVIKQLLDANLGHFQMFIKIDSHFYKNDTSWQLNYRFRPFGMVMMVSSPWDLPDQAYVASSEKALPNLDPKLLEKYPEGTWENLALEDYWAARYNRADFLITSALSHGNDRNLLEAGASALEDITTRFPKPPAKLFKELGFAYSKLSAYDFAYRDKMKAAWSRYLELGPSPNDPDLMEIRNAVSN